MIALVSSAVAGAADIHVELAVGEGQTDTWEVPYSEAVSRKIGPIADGKTTALYTITMQPSVWDTLVGAFRVDLSVCREWSKKGKPGRYCQKEAVLAKSHAEGPTESTTNLAIAGEKFSYVITTWYLGEAPGPVGLPSAPPVTDGGDPP